MVVEQADPSGQTPAGQPPQEQSTSWFRDYLSDLAHVLVCVQTEVPCTESDGSNTNVDVQMLEDAKFRIRDELKEGYYSNDRGTDELFDRYGTMRSEPDVPRADLLALLDEFTTAQELDFVH